MCLCLGVRVKVVYQPRRVVRRRETKVALAYNQGQLSVLRKEERERQGSNTHRVHAPAKVNVIETSSCWRVRAFVSLPASVLILGTLGKSLVRTWVDVPQEDEAVEWSAPGFGFGDSSGGEGCW
jgi:hypothetical protein